tara:strand:+ start:493 stop:1884 length:1392 start_codon:yes stop_codon:yes gene_type:complete
MKNFQQTIIKNSTISGVGLHTGIVTNVTFKPAKVDHGIVFQRIDLKNKPTIKADVDNVTDVSRGTTLEENNAKISTIEHILAAIAGLEIDNILIEVDGPELPIMDGSSIQFIESLEKAGIKEQNAYKTYFEIKENIFYNDKKNNVEIAIYPHNEFRATVMVDYNSPVLGSQHYTLNELSKFKNEVANSRTFCFLHEVEELFNKNLIKGGDLNNAIVIVDKIISENKLNKLSKLLGKKKVKVEKEGILNNVKLRYHNEPARHKLLDVLGDITLLGKPIKGHIIAARTGHKSNVEFTKLLKKEMVKNESKNINKYNIYSKPVFDINDIKKILIHRYPFLLVDKILYIDDTKIVGTKNITFNESFFQGHFPDNPIMPGVLMIEAMGQVGGVLVLKSIKSDLKNNILYFVGLENFRFRKRVIPGDVLIMQMEFIVPIKRGVAKMKGEVYVGDELVCEGILTAIVGKK